MSTIITLRNQFFNNPNLPVRPRYISQGLLGAWRFLEPNKLDDVSGNDASLTVVGNPISKETGVVVNNHNGYQTNIESTESFTFITAFRLDYGGSSGTSPYIQIAGCLSRDAGIMSGAGITSGLFAQTPDDPTGPRYQSTLYIENQTLRSRVIVQPPPVDPYVSDWIWIASTFDKNSKVMKVYELSDKFYQETIIGETFDPSNLFWSIGNLPGGLGGGIYAELAEVAFYDRALTDDEVSTQFEYSKNYLYSKGVSIV